MCLILLAWRAHPRHRLVVAANRDEFHARAAAPAEWWPDAPGVLAGRDLEAGGTWLGVSRTGRFAAVTNFREGLPGSGRRSRGELVRGFLEGDAEPAEVARALAARGEHYAGFSLLVGDGRTLWCVSNRGDAPAGPLAPGVYGLSNHLLETPWAKVRRGKRALRELLAGGGEVELEALLALLTDRTPPAPGDVPDTALGPELAQRVGACFVVTPVYGTRCSTAVTMGVEGRVRFAERSFAPDGAARETRRFELQIG